MAQVKTLHDEQLRNFNLEMHIRHLWSDFLRLRTVLGEVSDLLPEDFVASKGDKSEKLFSALNNDNSNKWALRKTIINIERAFVIFSVALFCNCQLGLRTSLKKKSFLHQLQWDNNNNKTQRSGKRFKFGIGQTTSALNSDSNKLGP